MSFGVRDESHVAMDGRLFTLYVRDWMCGKVNVGV